MREIALRRLRLERRIQLARLAGALGAVQVASALIADLAEADPAAYRRLLWEHNLANSRRFLAQREFGRLVPSRQLLWDDLMRTLGSNVAAIGSVLDVGCSAGYLLRHAEVHAWPAARLLGLDVDRKALAYGRKCLAAYGSRVVLNWGDLCGRAADAREPFDLVLCTGVLQNLPQREAATAIARMLAQAQRLLVLTGPADRGRDNRLLSASTRRGDGTYVHNFDAMAEAAGGEVVWRRWGGAELAGGQSIYFAFARRRVSGWQFQTALVGARGQCARPVPRPASRAADDGGARPSIPASPGGTGSRRLRASAPAPSPR